MTTHNLRMNCLLLVLLLIALYNIIPVKAAQSKLITFSKTFGAEPLAGVTVSYSINVIVEDSYSLVFQGSTIRIPISINPSSSKLSFSYLGTVFDVPLPNVHLGEVSITQFGLNINLATQMRCQTITPPIYQGNPTFGPLLVWDAPGRKELSVPTNSWEEGNGFFPIFSDILLTLSIKGIGIDKQYKESLPPNTVLTSGIYIIGPFIIIGVLCTIIAISLAFSMSTRARSMRGNILSIAFLSFLVFIIGLLEPPFMLSNVGLIVILLYIKSKM